MQEHIHGPRIRGKGGERILECIGGPRVFTWGVSVEKNSGKRKIWECQKFSGGGKGLAGVGRKIGKGYQKEKNTQMGHIKKGNPGQREPLK